MKKLEFLLQGAIFLGLGFTAGYATAVWGPGVVLPPPVFRTLECIFTHGPDDHRLSPRPVASMPSPDVALAGSTGTADAFGGDARDRSERLSLEVGRLNTQIEELVQRDRERRIRIGLLERRDDPRDADALAALHDEVEMIASALAQVRAEKQARLDDLGELELVLDAESAVDAGSLAATR
ncbi:MAG: hypothetical protein H6825_05300 [Planctomycetes bacterium]|nr:hypothetical protein [Planctomycetota bacterium]